MLLLLAFACLLSSTLGADLPNVKLVDCSELKVPLAFDKCLIIKYAGGTIEYSGMVKVDGFDSILEGTLFRQNGDVIEDSRVSVTMKDGNKALVMISDPSDQELYQMKVDLSTGEGTKDTLPQDGRFHLNDEEEAANRMDPLERMMWLSRYNSDRQSTMPKVFKFRIQFVAEGNFKKEYGYKVDEKVSGVFNHLKTYYSHSSLEVKFDLVKMPIKHLPEKITITAANVPAFGEIAKKKVASGQWPDADTYILLSPKNDGRLYGKAQLGWIAGYGVCSSRIEKRVSINWFETDTYLKDGYQDDDLLTALTVVHETGHNLGMQHDFHHDKSKTSRRDSKGKKCKDVAAFMDYVFPPYTRSNPMPNHWSGCSVEDFKATYQSIKERTGNYCLKAEGQACVDKPGMESQCRQAKMLCKSSVPIQQMCKKTCNKC